MSPSSAGKIIIGITVVDYRFTVLGLRCGHLIYAKGSAEPTHYVVRGSGVEVVCHAVDLDAEPPDLLTRMRALAADIGGVAANPGQRPASVQSLRDGRMAG